MNCKNCNNTLAGTEDYCPYCGTPQKFPDLNIQTSEDRGKDKIPQPKNTENPIFQSEPVYIYTEPPKEKKDSKTKIAVSMVSIFLISLLLIGVFSLAQYFNLTPAFSSLLSTLPSEEPDTKPLETTTESEFDSSLGLVSPDISFKSTLCTVISENGLPLRKGPDNVYAQIDSISNGTSLQAIGKSLQNNLWVYVYVPSLDLYGWVSGSYISENSALREPDTAESAETTTENDPTEK